MKFTYTKPNGDVSHRKVIVIAPPSDNYLTLDCSDLDANDIHIMQDRLAQYEEAKKELLYTHRLQNYVKSFKASRMTDIEK